MRILQVSFKNLNSLAGRWQIDLAQPEFVSDGIFAITGPTGAGKTTILDAICLALYGCTPRLGKLGKGANELMSRQTGECFAEVVFETADGRFCSHWSQHRSRRKAGGELQAPKHEVSEVPSGKILASGVKESAATILTLTGMSFEQFSRSMMLAQGAFAAFLQAQADQRAPILEQITGSEIYSQISVRVHECRVEQRNRLEELEAGLQGSRVLDDMSRQQVFQEIARLDARTVTIAGQLQQHRSTLQAIEQIEAVRHQIQQNQLDFQLLFERETTFEPDRLKLQAASRALQIAPEYRELQIARTDQDNDQRMLDECQAQIPGMVSAVDATQVALGEAASDLARRQAMLAQMQPVIEQVRAYDARLDRIASAMESVRGSHTKLLHKIEASRSAEGLLINQLAQVGRLLESLQQQAHQTAGDEVLVSELSALTDRLRRLVDFEQLVEHKSAAVAAAQARMDGARESALQQKRACASKAQALAECEALVDRTQSQLLIILQGQTIQQWQTQQARSVAQQDLLTQVIQTEQEINTLSGLISRQQSRHEAAGAQLHTLQQTLIQKQSAHEMLKRQTQLLQQQVLLHRRIESYEQARAHLHDGQPCPLCGSLAHPYAQGEVPAADQSQLELEQAHRQLEASDAQIADLNVAQARLEQTRAQLSEDVELRTGDLARHQVRLDELLGRLEISPDRSDCPDTGLADRLKQRLQASLSVLDAAAQTLEQANALLVTAEQQRNALDSARKAFELAQQQDVVSRLELEAATGSWQQAQQALQSELTRRDWFLAEFVGQLKPYGLTGQSRQDIESFVGQLASRRSGWLELQQKLRDATEQAGQIRQKLQFHEQQAAATGIEIKGVEQQLEQLRIEHADVLDARQRLFGQQQPARVQQDLQVAVEQARVRHDDARTALIGHRTALERQRQRTEDLQARLRHRAGQIATLQEHFIESMHRAGFEGETGVQQALLDESERLALEQQQRQLHEQHVKLHTAAADLNRQLAQLRARVRSAGSDDDSGQAQALADHISRLDNEQRVMMETVGALRQKLADDDLARVEYAARLKTIEAQRLECERWDQLHALIGSADGKKYRMFAQGLTFEIVIRHANQQLRKMTDRYVLTRSVDQPLDLNVIDLYQAGEVRSTRNLSGGESFLVSLALALGLSKMASKNVRVDSLFLDEGFGTLDEEALDTALQTLASLHQEGKLIGVISHIQALKDRIATQIQVSPVRGGRSVLAGPGCEQVAESA